MRFQRADKTSFLKALFSFTLLVVFLLFGFCPLRNTLVKLVDTSPAKTGQPIPEYGKISSGSDCKTVNQFKVLPATGRILYLPSLDFAADISTAFFAAYATPFTIADAKVYLPADRWTSISIYLLNRVLRI